MYDLVGLVHVIITSGSVPGRFASARVNVLECLAAFFKRSRVLRQVDMILYVGGVFAAQPHILFLKRVELLAVLRTGTHTVVLFFHLVPEIPPPTGHLILTSKHGRNDHISVIGEFLLEFLLGFLRHGWTANQCLAKSRSIFFAYQKKFWYFFGIFLV